MSEFVNKARSATLAKGLEILNYIGSSDKPLTLRAVMSELKMTKPTAHRLLATLIDFGLIRFDPRENTYQLGMRLFELSRQVWQDFDLKGSAITEMQKLHALTGETVSLAILTPEGGVYIDELQSRHHLREQSKVGQRVPLWKSAIGKALISGLAYKERTGILNADEHAIISSEAYKDLADLSRHLDLVNARGYAVEVDEDLQGISGVAAPIVDHRGITVAAIGLSGASTRLPRNTLHDLGPNVIEATRIASLQAGGAPRPVSTKPMPPDLRQCQTWKVFDANNLIGEGPVLSRDGRYVFWVDICRPCIFRYDLESGQTDLFPQREMVTAVADTSDGLLISTLSGFRRIDLESGEIIKELGDPEREIPTNRYNDGKCDASGRFWVGSLAFNLEEEAGSLYRIDADGTYRRMAGGFTLPNGLGWSPDNKTMYLIDTSPRIVYAYDFDLEAGTISNRRNVIEFTPDISGIPDGLDVDADGNLWIAMWDGWCIRKYSGSGEFLQEYGVPFPRPTSCLHIHGKTSRLFATTARIRIDKDLLMKHPLSGALVELDVN